MKLKTDLGYNIFFSSDFHFGHKNIIKYSFRPFSGVAEMEKILLNNIDLTVKSNDIVFFLGDFTFDKRIAARVVPQLPGTWIWIAGNHEKDFLKYLRKNDIEYFSLLDIEIDDQPITLCHYPMLSWNKSHFGAWNLYGHHHWNTNIKEIFDGPKLNVAIENWDYYPVSFHTIKTVMKDRVGNWDFEYKGKNE